MHHIETPTYLARSGGFDELGDGWEKMPLGFRPLRKPLSADGTESLPQASTGGGEFVERIYLGMYPGKDDILDLTMDILSEPITILIFLRPIGFIFRVRVK